MKNNKRYKKSYTALAVALALSPSLNVHAETKQSDEVESVLKTNKNTHFEQILITGTKSSNMTVFESAVAVTVVDVKDILRKSPRSTADALELIPGITVEATGGEVSNNYTVRGLAGGGQGFIQLLEDGLPVKYNNALVDSMLKADLGVQRLEAIRGGTSGIFTVQGAGASINFVSRKAGEEPEGTIRLTGSSYNTRKVEFFYGAPLGNNWYSSIGGTHRVSDSVRDTGFTADRGGQFKFTLENRFSDGLIGFTYKSVDEHNTFLLPTPFQNFDNPEPIAGFDAKKGTMLSLDNSVMIGRNSENSGAPLITKNDLTDGFAVKSTAIGFYFEKDLTDNVSVNFKSRYLDFDLTANAVFNVDNDSIVSATDRIDISNDDINDLMERFNPLGATHAGIQVVSTGEILTADELANLNGNGFVTNGVSRSPWDATQEFIMDLNVNWEIDNHMLTAGVMTFDTRFERAESGMNTFLSEVTNNPRRLDIVALDEGNEVIGYLTESGVLSYGAWGESAASESRQSTSFYVNDEYQVNDDLRIDIGFRHETLKGHQKERQGYSRIEVVGAFDSDGNDVDNIIANNYILGGTGTDYVLKEGTVRDLTWTLGGNYTISDNFSVYGRYVDAFNMNGPWEENTALTFFELGLRFQSDTLWSSFTVFDTEFIGQQFESQSTTSDELYQFVGDYNILGVEFDFTWAPIDSFRLNIIGVLQDGELSVASTEGNNSVFDGNKPARSPNYNFTVSPSYIFNDGEIYMSWQQLGERYADTGNSITLPSYYTINAGVIWYPTDEVTLSLNIQNITDEIGLTEGNPRGGFVELPDGSGSDIFFARSISGRNMVFSLAYDF